MVDRIRATRLNDLNPTLDRCIPDLEVARPISQPRGRSLSNEPLTAIRNDSERCGNPFCKRDMKARSGKKVCCDRCRLDAYVLRRPKAMIAEVGIIEFNEMLERF
jgi:hypothetical protein